MKMFPRYYVLLSFLLALSCLLSWLCTWVVIQFRVVQTLKAMEWSITVSPETPAQVQAKNETLSTDGGQDIGKVTAPVYH